MGQVRQPKGAPTGGRFAASARSESDVTLHEMKSAAQRAIDEAYEAGIAEGLRRAAGGTAPAEPAPQAPSRTVDGIVIDLDLSHTSLDCTSCGGRGCIGTDDTPCPECQ